MTRGLLFALVFALGAGAPAWADPGQSSGCGDHIHVKGHVRTSDGQGVSNATVAWDGGGADAKAGMSTGKELPFLQGLPQGCVCNFRLVRTGGDGSYDLKIEISQEARCLSAVDRVTVDKNRLYFHKTGVTIVPAP